jgi:hypothetical protein
VIGIEPATVAVVFTETTEIAGASPAYELKDEFMFAATVYVREVPFGTMKVPPTAPQA